MAEDWEKMYTKLKKKYAKSENGRKHLREGLNLLELRIEKLQADNDALKKGFEDEKAEKEKESTARVMLDNEISALRSKIQVLENNQKTGNLDDPNLNEKVIQLEQCISEREQELRRINELLGKEKIRADSEKIRADSEKKRADSEKKKAETEIKKVNEAMKKPKSENDRVQEDKKQADHEKKKIEGQLKALQIEVEQVKLKNSKFEEKIKKLEDEKEKLCKEKKNIALTLTKAEEKKKLTEADKKKATNEKNRADFLSKQLELERKKVIQLEKDISELSRTESEKAQGKIVELQEEKIKEKKRADLEEKKAKEQIKVANLYKKKAEEEKLKVDKLCEEIEEKKRKIEEMHSIVEKLVSSRSKVNSSLQVTNRASNSESAKVKVLEKKLRVEKTLTKLAKEKADLEVARNCVLLDEVNSFKHEFVKLSQHLELLEDPIFSSEKKNLKRKEYDEELQEIRLLTEKEGSAATSNGSDTLMMNEKQSGPLVPIFGGSHTESISGIDSTVEPKQKKLQSSASFSDRTLMGSQERGVLLLLNKSAEEKEKEKSNSKPSTSSSRLFDSTRKMDQNSIPNPQVNLCSDDFRCHKKRKIVSEKDIIKEAEKDEIDKYFDSLDGFDYMKLLELDNDVDEKAYRAALESPLSPTLPKLDFNKIRTHSNNIIMDNTRFCDNHNSSGELSTADVAILSNIPRYCVVSSDIIQDRNSISRIFGVISKFKSQCSIVSSSKFVQDILVSLLKAEELSSQEKICTFISLLLQNICETVTKSFGNVLDQESLKLVDFLHCNMKTVLSDIEAKINLHELLNFLEDFLISGKVIMYGELSSESKETLILNDNVTKLCVQAAPSHFLVSGGVLLASICSSINHVGFICEASCNILKSYKSDSSHVLIILHLFAYICGDKYFVQEGYVLAMKVVRSLVVYLDEETKCKVFSNRKCLFLEDGFSINDVVSLLFEELNRYSKDESHLFDILSLFELVACYMSWDWSFDNIICPMMKLLESESYSMEQFCAPVITFLGQLGRSGIEKGHGYENAKVDKLRDKLTIFLRKKLGIIVELASANALINLTPLSCEEVVNNSHDRRIMESVDCIKKWVCSLSKGQQSAFKSEVFSTMKMRKMDLLFPQVST